jgi:glycosyltransferase involved in cell wall biosynthesis
LKNLEEKHAYSWWLKKGVMQNNIFRVIFIGSFSRAFDFDLIFNVANHFLEKKINCEFILCGDGEFKKYLKKKSQNFSNIKIIDWIDLPKAITLSRMSSAFIAPYKNKDDFMKSIPNKVIDAIKFGIPLLSSLKGEVESLIKKNEIGFIYYNEKSLINIIDVLLNNVNLHRKISNNCKKIYKEKFKFNKIYNKLIQNLENLKKIDNN